MKHGSLYNGTFAVKLVKPWRVQYCITAKEFCDLCSDYIKQRFGVSLQFEMKACANLKGDLLFKFEEGISKKARRDIEDIIYAGLLLDNDTPFNNFEAMAVKLFGASGPGFECTAEMVEDDDPGPHVFAYVDYKDYVIYGGDTTTE